MVVKVVLITVTRWVPAVVVVVVLRLAVVMVMVMVMLVKLTGLLVRVGKEEVGVVMRVKHSMYGLAVTRRIGKQGRWNS